MIFLQVILNFYYTGWLMVVGLSPIARLWDLGGGMPSVGVFLRDPGPYLREFRRKPRKTPNG